VFVYGWDEREGHERVGEVVFPFYFELKFSKQNIWRI
jgi:hypothetical protein